MKNFLCFLCGASFVLFIVLLSLGFSVVAATTTWLIIGLQHEWDFSHFLFSSGFLAVSVGVNYLHLVALTAEFDGLRAETKPSLRWTTIFLAILLLALYYLVFVYDLPAFTPSIVPVVLGLVNSFACLVLHGFWWRSSVA